MLPTIRATVESMPNCQQITEQTHFCDRRAEIRYPATHHGTASPCHSRRNGVSRPQSWRGQTTAFRQIQRLHGIRGDRRRDSRQLRPANLRRLPDAESLAFCALAEKRHGHRTVEQRRSLSDWPLPRPRRWIENVNRPQNDAKLDAIRRCVIRGTPMGSANWIEQAARELGLESTLRSRGRPWKADDGRAPQPLETSPFSPVS